MPPSPRMPDPSKLFPPDIVETRHPGAADPRPSEDGAGSDRNRSPRSLPLSTFDAGALATHRSVPPAPQDAVLRGVTMPGIRCVDAALPRCLHPMLPWACLLDSRLSPRHTRHAYHRSGGSCSTRTPEATEVDPLAWRHHSTHRSEPCDPLHRRPLDLPNPLSRTARALTLCAGGNQRPRTLIS
jgi:hypothetical protein